MRHRLATGVLVALLLAVTSVVSAQEREARSPRDREGSRIIRVVRQIVKSFLPSSNGDFASPPKP